MAGNDDLFKALQMFSQGVKEYQIQSAVGQANQFVQQIKAADLNEQQKRAALQDLSNQLVSQMAGMGAPATQVAQVAGAIGPKQFASPDQAILEGTLTGNNALVDMGVKADKAATANTMALYEKKAAIDEASQRRLFDHQLTMGLLKQTAENKQKQSQGDLEFSTNVQVAMKEANKLENIIKRVGNWEKFDTKASAQLESAAYQLAINYAKIVDPASVAREGEVEAAKKYLIPLGIGTRNDVSIAAVQEFKSKIKEYVKARGQARGQVAGSSQPATSEASSGGFDFSRYLEP